jgi:hypothetical protein
MEKVFSMTTFCAWDTASGASLGLVEDLIKHVSDITRSR